MVSREAVLDKTEASASLYTPPLPPQRGSPLCGELESLDTIEVRGGAGAH